MKNHYQTLGLEEGASQEAIQEAYDRLYKELDPANNNNQEFFIEEFEKLQEAYKVLRNSSILSATSKTAEVSTSSTDSSTVKKTDRNLKPQKGANRFNIKKTKLIQQLVQLFLVDCLLIYYSNQINMSYIKLYLQMMIYIAPPLGPT